MSKSSKNNVTSNSERLELAKAISSMTTKQDAFIKAVENMKEFDEEALKKLDLEMDSRKQDLAELERNIERIKKNGQIEVDQFLAEYKYTAAKKILLEHKEEPIEKSTLDKLNNELEDLRENKQDEIVAMKLKEKEKSAKAMAAALKNADLKHKAEIAELGAENKQNKHEINSLQKTIDNLTKEVSCARELTQKVAEASRPSFNLPTTSSK